MPVMASLVSTRIDHCGGNQWLCMMLITSNLFMGYTMNLHLDILQKWLISDFRGNEANQCFGCGLLHSVLKRLIGFFIANCTFCASLISYLPNIHLLLLTNFLWSDSFIHYIRWNNLLITYLLQTSNISGSQKLLCNFASEKVWRRLEFSRPNMLLMMYSRSHVGLILMKLEMLELPNLMRSLLLAPHYIIIIFSF